MVKSDAELIADYESFVASQNGGNLEVPFKSVVYERDLSKRCTCGTEIPCVADFHFRYGCIEVVGHGNVTNPDRSAKNGCGHFYGLLGCSDVNAHALNRLAGKRFLNKAFMRKLFRRCYRDRCPECYRSWASREAKAIADRLKATKGVFGKEEHVMHSPDTRSWDWSGEVVKKFEKLRESSMKYMQTLGVVGGVQIPHGFRYANKSEALEKNVPWGWYWSPHFHYLCYLDVVYRCRGCPNLVKDSRGAGLFVKDHDMCMSCDGFEGKCRKGFDAGFGITKVKAERVSVQATGFYQLNHASTRNDVANYRVVKWFGCVSYRRFHFVRKTNVERGCCKICGHELEYHKFVGVCGSEPIGYYEDWCREFFDDFLDGDGCPRYVVVKRLGGVFGYGGGG